MSWHDMTWHDMTDMSWLTWQDMTVMSWQVMTVMPDRHAWPWPSCLPDPVMPDPVRHAWHVWPRKTRPFRTCSLLSFRLRSFYAKGRGHKYWVTQKNWGALGPRPAPWDEAYLAHSNTLLPTWVNESNNYSPILYRFQDIATYWPKIANVPPPKRSFIFAYKTTWTKNHSYSTVLTNIMSTKFPDPCFHVLTEGFLLELGNNAWAQKL